MTGVIPVQQIKGLIEKGIIKSAYPITESQFQPASLDLRVGNTAYRIRSSFLPQRCSVEERLKDLFMYEIDLSKNGILEKGNIYLIPLMEELNLPDDIRGRTNPKSTTGRLDIFTRVITDYSHRFEDIDYGYKGKLYLEVVTRSFTIKIEPCQSLNQLRLFRGEGRLNDNDLRSIYDRYSLLYNEGGSPLKIEDVKISDGLFMCINLKGDHQGIIGYKAKRNSAVIVLNKNGFYDAADYWEPIYPPRNDFLIIEPEEFYIFSSKERVRVPPDYAAEMVEYDAGSGELRTHYAGFFDSGFGYGAKGEMKGTKAVLEVRPHDVPFRIEDNQIFFKIKYERMIETPVTYYGMDIGSSYYNQELALSKQFKRNRG
ncbi:MAG: 2'-deoxycytidine 5'-triphosphate deaminase [Nitrospinae bacterium]|nr:2'-deoxycytidine 5'-triphosphate deaminase [Nitrospinota bacterium]MBI3815238.1 2'-deoxycytidine 5'-triphosphate deaminase [Nitrospinota bacterium]